MNSTRAVEMSTHAVSPLFTCPSRLVDVATDCREIVNATFPTLAGPFNGILMREGVSLTT
jgi:hypothetical protein